MITCPNCKEPMDDNLQFCTKCGAKLYSEKRFCPSCGAENNAQACFCQNCGLPFSARIAQGEAYAINNQSNNISNYDNALFKLENEYAVVLNNLAGEHTITGLQDCIERLTNLGNYKDAQTILESCKIELSEKVSAIPDYLSNQSKQSKSSQKKNSAKKTVLAILIVCLVGLNGYQFYLYNDLSNDYVEIKETAENQKETNSTQKSKITSLTNENKKLKTKAEYFDDICSFSKSDSIGYSSSNFRSSESVIVVDKNTTNRKFTLTANWSGGGTVSATSSDYSVASVDFDSNNWSTSTKMTIHPYKEGVAKITFSSNVNSKTFCVIIIVV